MKKILCFIFALLIPFTLSGCRQTRTNITDYQYIYDMVDDWNKTMLPYKNNEDIFGYGEYLYNSHLILFPRETPGTLKEFYFDWEQGMDFDFYAIYFTCELTKENYELFKEGLADFKLTTGAYAVSPLYDTEHFKYPAYILQWCYPGGKHEVLEYLLLDDANNTVVFVYTMNFLEEIKANSSYDVSPSEIDFLEDYFSIYSRREDGTTVDTFKDAEYSLDFLKYLN